MIKYCISIVILLLSLLNLKAQQAPKGHKPDDGSMRQASVFNTTVPEHAFDVIAARPTSTSICLSVLCYTDTQLQVEYWSTTSKKQTTELKNCKANVPVEFVLSDLKSDTRYYYRLKTASANLLNAQTAGFHTQRKAGSSFTFTITADSHLDENADTAIYKQTLLNAAADSADFHFDLGDTFMTDKYRQQYKDAFSQYLAQRYYLGLLCASSPLFFVQGNHDGESGQRLNGRDDNMTIWANKTRTTYFPNPIPNTFYSGNADKNPFVENIQDYYAFEWGNALFVVLDPFWYTPRAGMQNPWDRTLGKQQYEWLRATLAASKATFKFVFIHNLVGGADIKGIARGGAEVTGMYEWGGKNADGTDGFASHRPDWEMPIHALLVKNKVTAVFHGHDHLFAKQDVDGIVYQCLSQPGAKERGNTRNAEEYGYKNGKILNAPGYMKVQVSPNAATFQFLSTDKAINSKNKTIECLYTIKK